MKKLKQVLIWMTLAVFLISLMPGVLAEPTEKADKNISAKEKGVTGVKPVIKETKEQIKETKEKYEPVLKQAKEEFKEAKERFVDSKKQLVSLRKEIKECKTEGDCQGKKEEWRTQSVKHLVKLADVVLDRISKLKEKIEKSELNTTEKNELLSNLDTQAVEVKKAKATLENITGNLTDTQVKEAVQTIKDAWKKAKPHLQVGLAKLNNAKLGNIIVQVEQLEKKLEKIKERLKEKGADVTSLESYMTAFKSHLDSAKKNWEKAKESFSKAKLSADASQLIKEAHEYQKKAREDLKEARADLRNIVKEIREQNKKAKSGNNSLEE